jgi:ATP-dependent RNA helicase RhlB
MSNRRMLNLHQFNYVVIDEADRMFDMGFVHDVQTILRKLPPREARQTMLFSATLSSDVKRLAASSMNDPAEVHIAAENITVEKIDQQVYHVGTSQKMPLLLGLLGKYGNGRALIFVNMKHMAEEIAERLRGNGFNAEHLTGDLAQNQRQRRIDAFKNNELPILVATDVAARGIHVDDLELVVNFDIPMHSENYVHRIGRTARAGKSGHAVTLACETYVEFLAPVEEFIRMKIPSVVADDELYLPDATAGRHFGRSRREFGKERRGSGSSSRSSGRSGSSGSRRTSQRSERGSSSGRSGGERSSYRSGSGGNERHSDGNERPSGSSGRSRQGSGNSSGSRSRNRPDGRSGNDTMREQRPPQDQATGNAHADRQHTRTPRKTGEGRIPSSHSHDKRSFEKQQHHQDHRPGDSAKPAKKKGLFAKVISFFR